MKESVMIRSLPVLFVSDNAACHPPVQATLCSPPASEAPVAQGRAGMSEAGPGRLKFMAGVAADAAGFTGLIAGCWAGLQILQAFL
jgi:hypothetical protein